MHNQETRIEIDTPFLRTLAAQIPPDHCKEVPRWSKNITIIVIIITFRSTLLPSPDPKVPSDLLTRPNPTRCATEQQPCPDSTWTPMWETQPADNRWNDSLILGAGRLTASACGLKKPLHRCRTADDVPWGGWSDNQTRPTTPIPP